MKNLLTALICLASINSLAQRFTVTPQGLKDSKDTSNTYLMIQSPNAGAKQLYDEALKYINENIPDPQKAITEQIDSTSIRFDVYVPELLIYNNSGAKIGIEAFYTTDLRFFDGRFRYEIINLQMKGQGTKYKLLFQGGFLEAYIVYNRKGKLFKTQTKWDIEDYFNNQVDKLASYINKN